MGQKEEILSRIDFVSYYEKYFKFETKHGNNWSALCPFHKESKPSFFVEAATGRWVCKGSCSVGGDLFSFHMKYHNCNFKESLEQLAKEYGVEDESDNEDFNDVPIEELQKNEDIQNAIQALSPNEDSNNKSNNSKSNKTDNNAGKSENSQTKKDTRGRPGKYPKLEDEVIQKLHSNLKEEEREYLHSRGISDETIDKLQIGTWSGINGRALVFPVRRNGKLYNLRFYKPATDRSEKDVRQMPKKILGYRPLWLFPEPNQEEEDIYLFEGEPDAMCAISLGLNATTVTGGAGEFLDEFLPYFKDKRVFVCYDVDQKGRIGSKAVARKIATVASEVRIIYLDLDKEKYPKGDFNDYIVKAGKTISDFEKLKEDSTHEIYTGQDLAVFEDEGAYHRIKPSKDGEVVIEKITNFTISLKCRYIREDSMVREIVMIHEKRKTRSDRAIIEPSHMSDARSFRTFCYSCGDFMFEGTIQDLTDIFHLVCAQDPDAKVVRQMYQVGYISQYDIWLFENMAIKNNKVIRPDDRGIYWNGSAGYSLMPIDSSDDALRHVPNLIISDKDNFGLIKELCEKITLNIGNMDASLGVGLILGSIYFNEIISNEELGCFPILFVYGNHRSGKTEYVKFLMRMFGMDKSDAESLPSITSTVPISRRLAYYSCIPSWWDEYRNDNPRTQSVIGTLRSAYDGVGRSIGAKASKGVHYETVKSTVIISGEHLPNDEAFKSRLFPIHIVKSNRKIEYHKDVLRISAMSAAHTFNLVKDKNKESENKLINKILRFKDEISKARPEMDERTIKNYAIALGCYSCLVNPDDKIIPDHIINGNGIVPLDRDCFDEDEPEMTQLLQEFADMVQSEIESGIIHKGVSWYHISDNNVYVWLTPIYEAYAERYRRVTGEKPPNVQTIKSQFKSFSFCLDTSVQHRVPNTEDPYGKNKKCVLFQLDKLPKVFRNWFSQEDY